MDIRSYMTCEIIGINSKFFPNGFWLPGVQFIKQGVCKRLSLLIFGILFRLRLFKDWYQTPDQPKYALNKHHICIKSIEFGTIFV